MAKREASSRTQRTKRKSSRAWRIERCASPVGSNIQHHPLARGVLDERAAIEHLDVLLGGAGENVCRDGKPLARIQRVQMDERSLLGAIPNDQVDAFPWIVADEDPRHGLEKQGQAWVSQHRTWSKTKGGIENCTTGCRRTARSVGVRHARLQFLQVDHRP